MFVLCWLHPQGMDTAPFWHESWICLTFLKTGLMKTWICLVFTSISRNEYTCLFYADFPKGNGSVLSAECYGTVRYIWKTYNLKAFREHRQQGRLFPYKVLFCIILINNTVHCQSIINWRLCHVWPSLKILSKIVNIILSSVNRQANRQTNERTNQCHHKRNILATGNHHGRKLQNTSSLFINRPPHWLFVLSYSIISIPCSIFHLWHPGHLQTQVTLLLLQYANHDICFQHPALPFWQCHLHQD